MFLFCLGHSTDDSKIRITIHASGNTTSSSQARRSCVSSWILQRSMDTPIALCKAEQSGQHRIIFAIFTTPVGWNLIIRSDCPLSPNDRITRKVVLDDFRYCSFSNSACLALFAQAYAYENMHMQNMLPFICLSDTQTNLLCV